MEFMLNSRRMGAVRRDRGMARDRSLPSLPYGEEGFSPTVARGPVPRERKSTCFFIVARGPVPRERKGTRFFTVARGPVLRERKGARFFTVARGPVPRERWITRTMARDRSLPSSPYGLEGLFSRVDRGMARDRPSPYHEGGRFSTQKPSRSRSAGACPPRSSRRPRHGEGQALALRIRGVIFFL